MARSSDSNFIVAFFTDKSFQAREIRRVIMLSLIYLVITTSLLGFFYHQLLGSLVEGMAPLLFVSEDAALVNEAVPALSAVLSRWLIAMLVVNVIITFLVSLYIARRLGHPIMAIKRALNEIGEGNLDVRLRSADSKEFGEISSALTSAMHSIRSQIAKAKKGIDEVAALQLAPRDAADTSDNEKALEKALDHCRGALNYFQLDVDLGPANNSGHPDSRIA